MTYDKTNPLSMDIQPALDEPSQLRQLAEQGFFVYDADFYARIGHPDAEGVLRIIPPFWGGFGILIDHTGDVEIGPFTFVDDFAQIYSHDHPHGFEPKFWNPDITPKRIGSYVFIGKRALVCASCKEIGEGAYIMPGAVVTKDVGPWTIVGGNPAEFVCNRPKQSAFIDGLDNIFRRAGEEDEPEE